MQSRWFSHIINALSSPTGTSLDEELTIVSDLVSPGHSRATFAGGASSFAISISIMGTI
jgi:hypothetical protein